MKKSNVIKLSFFAIFSALLLISANAANAQNGNGWVRVRNGRIPEKAIVGGYETNGRKTYVCRTRYRGSYIGGKALDDRCYYNPGSKEVSASRFEVLIGSQYTWGSARNYGRAVAVGGSDTENYYVCRVKTSDGQFSGRTEDGRCYYTKNNRGYSRSRYQVLVGNRYKANLLESASRGDYRAVQDALRDGQAKNQIDGKGKTALMLASENGYERVVRDLLYERVAIDLLDKSGNSALMLAASKGHSNIVRSLIQEGANIKARNNDGDTAFTLAASSGHRIIVEDFLSDSRNDLDPLDAERAFRKAAYYGHTDVLQSLVNYGVNIEGANIADGKTALMQAALGGKSNALRFLLNNNANINARDNRGWTPFLFGVSSNSEKVLAIFMEEKSLIRAVDKEAERALRFAASNDKRKSLKYLLQIGIDKNSKSVEDRNTALILAARKGHSGVCKILILANVDLNVQNTFGKTALMLAAANSKNKSTKALVKAGADLNLRDDNGMTALGLAIQNKHKDTRKTLKKAGAKK